MSKAFIKNASISGVIARSCGVKADARSSQATTYAYYKFVDFKTFVGDYGDLYDRMLLMVSEITESVFIITQVLYRTFVHHFCEPAPAPSSYLSYKNQFLFTQDRLAYRPFA